MTKRLCMPAFLACIAMTFPMATPASAKVLLSENFDGLPLMENVEEGIAEDMPVDEAWSNIPPNGWAIDNLDTPEGGVTEWRGWSFADPFWWNDIAGQGRDQFLLFSDEGTGDVIAVADGDEWDDKPHGDGPLNTLLSTPQIPIKQGSPLIFETSWRADNCCGVNQTATITASYDGGEPVEILRWESDPNSDTFEPDLNPGTVEVPVTPPNGAQNVMFNFGYVGGNNWWWAIDNINYGSFTEDFESVEMMTNVDEGRALDEVDKVWTNVPPDGWSKEDEVPGMDEDGDNNGVQEWIGWSFAKKDWWTDVAGDQRRSEFTKGQNVIAVADPDEWDDAAHPDSASEGWYNTFLSTPEISLEGVEANSVVLKFDSSWRPEFDDNYHQTGNITVSFDGGPPQEIVLWESDPDSDDFKDDNSTNETIELQISNPDGANSMVITFGMFDAGNDWWWAIDNLEITDGSVGDPCDFDGDGTLGLGDVNMLLSQIATGDNNLAFDVNSDGAVNQADINFFVGDESKLHTYIGDANLDGEFDSGDLVQMFQSGKYETDAPSTWADGDFNGDAKFDSGDLVAAFQDGGYELGPKWAGGAASVPEPCSMALFLLGLISLSKLRRK